MGADGLALDVHGDVYVGVGVQNSLVAVRTDSSIDTLATADDGLNQPSTLAFGTGMSDRKTPTASKRSESGPGPTGRRSRPITRAST